MKDAIPGLLVAVLLIVIFSTMGAPEAMAPPDFNGGWPVSAGDSGVVVAGSGATPAEVETQPETHKETTPAEVKAQPETPEETTPAEVKTPPVEVRVTLSEEQRATCNLVAAFLAGAACVLFLEIIVQAKKEEQYEPKV